MSMSESAMSESASGESASGESASGESASGESGSGSSSEEEKDMLVYLVPQSLEEPSCDPETVLTDGNAVFGTFADICMKVTPEFRILLV